MQPETVASAPVIELAKAEAMVFRVPIEQPVVTSFGTMHSRPSVVIRVEAMERPG
jgi:hypothetical protein